MALVNIIDDGVPILFIRISDLIFWVLVQNDDAGPNAEMWKSLDGGNTWVQIGGEGPSSIGWTGQPIVAVWDGGHIVTAFYNDGNFTDTNFLQQFDMNAGTWGAPFAELDSGDPTTALVPFGIVRKSNGDLQVVYQTNVNNVTPQVLPIFAQTWNGVSWSSAVHISASAEASADFDPATMGFRYAAIALQSNDVLHVVFQSALLVAPFGQPFLTFYQQVLANGALGNFFEFPSQTGPTPDLEGLTFQAPPTLLISGNSLYWGVIRINYGPGLATFPAVYAGTPLSNPNWVETGNLDPGASFEPSFGPSMFANGTTLVASFATPQDPTGQQLRAVSSPDGFTSSSLQVLSTDLTSVSRWSPFLTFGGMTFVVEGSPPAEGGTPPTIFTVAPGPAPVVVGIKITIRGVKVVPKCHDGEISRLPDIVHVKRVM